MPKQFVTLSKAQWEVLMWADSSGTWVGAGDFSLERLESLTKPRQFNGESICLLYKTTWGVYGLTDDGQQHVNLKKYRDAHVGQLEAKFAAYWADYGDSRYVMTRQAVIIPNKKFAFDFAFLEQRVLVDVQGGTATNGAHVRVGGYNRDCLKLMLAQLEGYQVFWFTAQMLSNDILAAEHIGLLTRALDNAEKTRHATENGV